MCVRWKQLTRRRWQTAGARFLAALGVGAIPIGIIAPLAPRWWEGQWWISTVLVIAAALWAVLALRYKLPEQRYRDNVRIKLVVGDILDQEADALIGMTTTFDTEVPDVIAPTSLQAAMMNHVFGGSQAAFDAALDRALLATAPVKRIEKAGKQLVYAMGTAASIHVGSRHFHCVAYTEMKTDNRAFGSISSVLEALDSCWNAADSLGNGEAICVPLIGQGQSRIPELTPEIAIRLIAFSFLLRSKRSRFSRELRIVIHPSDEGKVNAPEFQAFLTSLAAA